MPAPHAGYLASELAAKEVRLEELRTYSAASSFKVKVNRFLETVRHLTYPGDRKYLPAQVEHARRERENRKAHQAYSITDAAYLCSQVMSRLRPIRSMERKLETVLLATRFYHDLFARVTPDVIVVGSPGFGAWREEVHLLREAKAAGIPTIYPVISWDHPSNKGLLGAQPDYVLVWGERMKQEFMEQHDVPEANIRIVGTPLADVYVTHRHEPHRECLINAYRLDPNRRIIFFGTISPTNHDQNVELIEILTAAAEDGSIGLPAQLIVRPHPIYFHPSKGRPDELRKMRALAERHPHLHIVEPKPLEDNTMDLGWNEMLTSMRLVYGCDIMINQYSTLQIEAAVADRPIINIAFEPVATSGRPPTILGSFPHNARVVEAHAAREAGSANALIAHINAYLQDSTLDSAARKQIAQQEMGLLDGKASARIANFVLQVAQRQQPVTQ